MQSPIVKLPLVPATLLPPTCKIFTKLFVGPVNVLLKGRIFVPPPEESVTVKGPMLFPFGIVIVKV